MGGYGSEDEALTGLARQLTDAYLEARKHADQDYACDSIAEFLSEFKETAPSEALLAILDLPLTVETYPLVDEAQMALAGRGSEVVELLLRVVCDAGGSTFERAAETLEEMDPREAAFGLARLLCRPAGDELKSAAVNALVALGAVAEPELVATLDDRRGEYWASAALRQIRIEQTRDATHEDARTSSAVVGVGEGAASGGEDLGRDGCDDEGWMPDGALHDRAVDGGHKDHCGGRDVADGGATGEGGTDHSNAPQAELPERSDARSATVPQVPDLGAVNDAYEEFLRRFEEDSGEPPPS